MPPPPAALVAMMPVPAAPPVTVPLAWMVIGPTVPARFVGHLNGSTATVTVTVNDTVQHQTVVRGPVVVKLGTDPRLGPCPICRRPIVTKAPASWMARLRKHLSL